jgi:hypothetical protein
MKPAEIVSESCQAGRHLACSAWWPAWRVLQAGGWLVAQPARCVCPCHRHQEAA